MSAAAGPRPGQLYRVGAALFVFALGCAIYASFARGVWLDEFWSLHLGDPNVPLAVLFERRWLSDTNPVAANLLYYLTAASGARDIGGLRLILNLPATLLLLTATWRFTRGSASRDPFYVVLAMLVVSLPAFVATFGDYRAYHWQLCAAAVLLQYVYRIIVDAPGDRPYSALALVALVAALTLHFVAGLLVSALVGLLLLHLAHRKEWPAFAAIVIPSALAWAFMLIFFDAQYRRIAPFVEASWIGATTLQALMIMGTTFGAALLANPAAFAFALMARDHQARPRVFIPLLLVGIAIGAALLLALNWRQPIVVDRYLLVWQPMVCAIAAALGARAIASGGWRLYVVAGVAALSVAATTVRQSRETGWNGTRDFIAAEVRRCPSTRVVAISPWRLKASRASRAAAHERPVFEAAYRKLARDAGFAVAMVPDEVATLDIPAACPLLLWIEHSGGRRLGDAASLVRAAGLSFVQPAQVSRFASRDGIVVIARRSVR